MKCTLMISVDRVCFNVVSWSEGKTLSNVKIFSRLRRLNNKNTNREREGKRDRDAKERQ
jgi:hypothetical protein